MQKVEIDRNKELSAGDVVELHFSSVGLAWLKATQIALIDWQLEGRKEFDILDWQLPESTKIIFKVRINKTNPVVITAAVIAAAIIAAGVVAWLTLDKVYQIIETPAGKIGVAGLGIGGIALAIFVIFILLSRKNG